MEEHIFTELLSRFKIQTCLCLEIVGATSKFETFQISMNVDLTSNTPDFTIEDFGYLVFDEWTQLNYTDNQYIALELKMQELVNSVENEIKENNCLDGAFDYEDYNNACKLIIN